MFLFLSSIGLGASRRQTQCPQRRLNRRLKEWDIFRTMPLLSSDWIIMQLLCKRREWFVFEGPEIVPVEMAEKRAKPCRWCGSALSCHSTPAAPLTSLRGPVMRAEPQRGPHTSLMPLHKKRGCDPAGFFSACWHATPMNALHRLRVTRLELPGNSPQDNGTKQKRNFKKKS